ncbi:MAG: DUF721 domain-containing protein [Phycisphaerales bacterium]|nr:DUF721 domain-containing protein [Phycisphaerales bacterium]
MNPGAAKHQLEKLREWRKPYARNLSLGEAIEKVASAARQADRGLSKVLEAWKASVPMELSGCCRPVALRAGTLEIACDSSAATYEVNRWLQGEGVAALAREGVPVLRVRLVGGSLGPKATASKRATDRRRPPSRS